MTEISKQFGQLTLPVPHGFVGIKNVMIDPNSHPNAVQAIVDRIRRDGHDVGPAFSEPDGTTPSNAIGVYRVPEFVAC